MTTVFFILYHRILRLFVNILILSADILITSADICIVFSNAIRKVESVEKEMHNTIYSYSIKLPASPRLFITNREKLAGSQQVK